MSEIYKLTPNPDGCLRDLTKKLVIKYIKDGYPIMVGLNVKEDTPLPCSIFNMSCVTPCDDCEYYGTCKWTKEDEEE